MAMRSEAGLPLDLKRKAVKRRPSRKVSEQAVDRSMKDIEKAVK